jgi:CRP-like cAMP-binding protein
MSEELEEYAERLSSLVPLNGLAPKFQEQVFAKAEIVKVKKKEILFKQGARDDFTFYLLDGDLDMFAGDQLIKQVTGGTTAALHPLAQLQPRQISAHAKPALKVLRVDRNLLDRLLSMADSPEEAGSGMDVDVDEVDDDGNDWLSRILQSELFSRIPPSNIQKLLATMESVEFAAGDKVVSQGGPGDYYYIVQAGTCAVTRLSSKGKDEITLAELSPGDSFGEEALISNSKRNASVIMLTDGELVRLTKDDFIELIKKPIISTVTLTEAHEMVAGGAVWLDVRFADEHSESAVPDSLNIPTNTLRSLADEKLDPGTPYIVYCDTGGRSSTATFLLAERGFDAYFVEGGYVPDPPEMAAVAPPAEPRSAEPAVVQPTPAGESEEEDLVSIAPAKVKTAPAPKPEPKPLPEPETVPDQNLEADVKAEALRAELAKAELQLAEARRIKEEAELAKQDAEKIIAEKLKAEREKLDEQATRAAATLEEAQRLKAELEKSQKIAEKEAGQRHKEQQARLQQLYADAEQKIKAEEEKLQEVYQRNAEELEKVQQIKEEAQARLAAEREEIEDASMRSKQMLEDAKQMEQQLATEAERRAEEESKREVELRAQVQAEINQERQRLEAEFAKQAELLEQARKEKDSAQAAREAAAREAEQIISEYKSAHEKLRKQESEHIAFERAKLAEESQQLESELESARQEREEAEQARLAAEAEAVQLRESLAQKSEPAVESGEDTADLRARETKANDLRSEIEAIEARAAQAATRLREAQDAEQNVTTQQRSNEVKLERTYETEDKLRGELQEDLDSWLKEQDSMQNSTISREKMHQQLTIAKRIKAKAEQAKHNQEQHDSSLLDEVATQLEPDK